MSSAVRAHSYDPDDRGGATKFGITQTTLAAARGQKVSEDDVRNLTRKEAADILVRDFMDKPGFDKVPDHVRAQIFDMSVNHGPKNAIKITQKALGLKETGKADAEFKAALADADPGVIKAARIAFYQSIVRNNPSQEKFLKGWLKRAEAAAGDGPPISGDETAIAAARAAQSLMLNMQEMLDVGKSDGTPVFTGARRASKILAARNALFETSAATWFRGQPNKVAAFRKWQRGEIKIGFPGADGTVEEINIRDVLPETVRIKIDADFMRVIKDEISVQNALEARAEKEFEKNSEALAAEITLRMQGGEDVLPLVDALRHDLEPETFTDLRRMAIEDQPINSDKVSGDLLRRAYDGEDVTAEAKVARFVDKKIDNGNYIEIINISRGGAAGIEDPIKTGRRYIIENLGGLSKELGVTGSALIAGAKRNYDEEIEKFRAENDRFPSQAEAFEIADKIIPRWSILETDKIAVTLPKPMFMELGEKSAAGRKLTPERLREIRDQTDGYFLNKHGGDAGAVADDPNYQTEINAIEGFERILNVRTQK